MKERRPDFSGFCASMLLLFALMVAGPTTDLAAETILLKSGQILTGSLVSQNKTSVTIQTENGRRTISKSRIRRIDFKSPEIVRREEQQRLQREAAERRKQQEEAAKEAAKKEAAERLKREAAERKLAREAAARADLDQQSESENPEESAGDPDPGRSLADLLGESHLGGGFEFHDSSSANFYYDGPTNTAGGNHLFERTMGARSVLAPVLFYEQSIWDPRLLPGIEAGFLYRKDRLRPGLLYPALSGWEIFVRPSIGARFGLTGDLFLHLRGYYAFAVTQLGREFYGPEWNLQRGLVLDQLDGIQRYNIHNPQYAGPGLRLAFEFDRFRVWVGRQWLSGTAGDARVFRDNWVVGVGVKL